jgi:glycosyltransferase involved in cell wall biosynthesis
MIVKNEAENLTRIFESIRDCFDEIHITDTGSTDGTVEIAKSLGAQVHHFTWINDFAAARNYSFSHATTEYIAWIDGDDVLENREGFIQFRDNVMSLNDYWIAPYHYTSDAEGRAICTFARERVLRRSMGFKWSYPIHEGIKPDSGRANPKVQYTPAWAVRHMRTDADLLKDRSRNLAIFEGIKKTRGMDSRETYYYGKELFEASQPIEAITQLLTAASRPDLEMHDRILAFQYLCYAYVQCNQFDRAIDTAHSGLMLAPQRAEFHALIGDCYLKLNRVADARPFFEAAKGCRIQTGSNGASAIFHQEPMYGVYPRNQLARIHFNTGDIEGAKREARECVERYGNEEGKLLLLELDKLQSAADFSKAVSVDDIVFTTPPQNAYEFDADTYKEKATGGSETALIEMAAWMHKLSGRPVKVFNMRQTDKVCEGVEYISTTKVAEYFAQSKPYLHIAWRHNIKITDAPTFVWSHDLGTPGAENHSQYERILCLTPFHKQYMMATQGVPEHKIHVTRNGLKPERFVPEAIERDPFKFIFSSSPDRGLDRSMRVLDRVRVKYPEVKLHIYYGIEHLDRYGLSDMRKNLAAMMEERKDWVIYHGATQQDELMREFKGAAYCIQPSDWIETSMISAIERLSCGVYQIIRGVGGCIDTLREANEQGMAKIVYSDCITEAEHDLYAAEVIQAIEEKAYQRVSVDPKKFAWENVAREWLTDLPRLAGLELSATG